MVVRRGARLRHETGLLAGGLPVVRAAQLGLQRSDEGDRARLALLTQQLPQTQRGHPLPAVLAVQGALDGEPGRGPGPLLSDQHALVIERPDRSPAVQLHGIGHRPGGGLQDLLQRSGVHQ